MEAITVTFGFQASFMAILALFTEFSIKQVLKRKKRLKMAQNWS